MSINIVQIIGNVGGEPMVKMLAGDVKVVNFSVATSETYVDKQGNKVTNTEWHNIVAWNKLATVVEKYIVKGQQLYISGKMKTRSYDDSQGIKHYITEIFANTIQMLGKKPGDKTDDTHSNDNESN